MPAVVYATVADVTTAIGESDLLAISDRDGSGEVDTASVEDALADASSTADSYMPQWLPLSDTPAVLRRHVIAMAVYALAGNAQTDDQRRRYEDAIRWLERVQSGKASLGIPPSVEDASSAGRVTYTTATRVMTRETLRGIL